MHSRWVFVPPTLLVLSLLTASTRSDESPRPNLQPVGQEAFEAITRFYQYDKTIPLQARVVEKKTTETTTREKIIFRGVRGFVVPAFLEIPKEAENPCPVVLLLHGWSGSKDSWWRDGGYISGGDMRRALLGAGYTVFALDAQAHGDRIAENDYALVNDFREDGQRTHRNYFSLNEIVTQTTVEYRRALDYLEGREDVDTKKVGMVGYSMGGIQAFLLTAVEPRLKVSVACVTPSLAGEPTPISPKDYARGVGDRPFLMLMGKTDSMCRPEHARQLLGFIPGETKELIFYDAGHKLPTAYVKDALAWVQNHLN